ncbi:Flp family type IVb pilin [Altererythrobacter indicus]|uniref:Flp family type IVb pilin n=1 Tax=Altericroceibacterium indicum TaxID=374177 RepID=A0A845A8A9_9SPHN|nr:Flp family type IVb pilin [Altericroceibacterium indicum]MXP25483.1 Flp family type IVb pilin [Altericroceibacterium indicum]
MHPRSFVKKVWKDKKAATAVEYALILALIAIAILVGVSQLGSSNKANWDRVATRVSEETQ